MRYSNQSTIIHDFPPFSRLKPRYSQIVDGSKPMHNPSTRILLSNFGSQQHRPAPPDVVPPGAPARLFWRSPAAQQRPESLRELDQIHEKDWSFLWISMDIHGLAEGKIYRKAAFWPSNMRCSCSFFPLNCSHTRDDVDDRWEIKIQNPRFWQMRCI